MRLNGRDKTLKNRGSLTDVKLGRSLLTRRRYAPSQGLDFAAFYEPVHVMLTSPLECSIFQRCVKQGFIQQKVLLGITCNIKTINTPNYENCDEKNPRIILLLSKCSLCDVQTMKQQFSPFPNKQTISQIKVFTISRYD